jgi:hypothetical protein
VKIEGRALALRNGVVCLSTTTTTSDTKKSKQNITRKDRDEKE